MWIRPVALSGLSHPNGVLYLVDFLVLTIWLDRKQWSARLVVLALFPYLAAAAAWGLYILQDPTDFVRQFFFNVYAAGRMSALASPLEAIPREFSMRYASAYGLASWRSHPFAILKASLLAAYGVALLTWLTNRNFRKEAGIGAVLLVGGINAVLLTFIDGQKRTYYLIHVIPAMTATLIAWVLWARKQPRWRALSLATALACGGVVTSLHLSRIRADLYHREYLAAVSFVQSQRKPEMKLIYIEPEYGFALGFHAPMISDQTFGFYSGRKPDLIVTTFYHNRDLSNASGLPVGAAEHVRRVLSNARLAFDLPKAQVFVPASDPVAP
jgi:hypothetical protein